MSGPLRGDFFDSHCRSQAAARIADHTASQQTICIFPRVSSESWNAKQTLHWYITALGHEGSSQSDDERLCTRQKLSHRRI